MQFKLEGGRKMLRLGDSNVELHPNFRLYLSTRTAHPYYPVHVLSKVNVINFTVTASALEDQLLGDVVRRERPELEEQHDQLIGTLSADSRQLEVRQIQLGSNPQTACMEPCPC